PTRTSSITRPRCGRSGSASARSQSSTGSGRTSTSPSPSSLSFDRVGLGPGVRAPDQTRHVRIRRGGNGSRPPLPRIPYTWAERHSPDERELARVLAVDRAVFAAPGVHGHLIRDATEARFDRGDVIAAGVGRVGVETLILG